MYGFTPGRGCLVIVEKSFDGATGTELPGEATEFAKAASDVNGLAPAGRVNFIVASPFTQIFPGIPRIRDTTNDKIAHVADHPTLLEPIVDARHEMPRTVDHGALRETLIN